MMFVEWFVWGLWFVPLWQYLNSLGFTASQIAWSYNTAAIAAVVSPVFIGVIADRYFSSQKVLAVLHLVGSGAMLLVAQQESFQAIFSLLLLYSLAYMPTISLTNSIAFRNLNDPSRDFPRVRVLGTIGWIFSGVLVGFVPAMLGFDDISSTNIPLIIAAIASLIMAVFSFSLPDTPPDATVTPMNISTLLGIDAISLMKDRNFRVFILCSFLFTIPLAFYYQLANGYLSQVGLTYATGWMSLGQVSEIFFMLALPFFLRRFGIKKVLLLGFIAAAVRYGFFVYGGTGHFFLTSLLFAGILLHGVSYDFYFVTAYMYVDKVAPIRSRASAQGFFALITLGLGEFTGNWVAGNVSEYYTLTEPIGALTVDWSGVWMFGMLIIIFVAMLFYFLFQEREG